MEETLAKKSKTASFNSFGNISEEKYSKIKSLIVAIEEYLTTWSKNTASIINGNLQTLSYTNDVSIFDPHKHITIKFFAVLCDLMNKLEPRCQMAWYCVDVLANICTNSAARKELIRTYNFLPSLSRFVGDHLSSEKKGRILKLLRDITCGIKINCQIPHLPHLMSTLVRWVETQSEEVVTVSLGVLVNLCYKNIPAITTLQRNVDIKELLRNCLSLQGPAVSEVYICILMLIIESICDVPTKTLENLVKPMFQSILEAYRNMDAILLRQIVEFYTDMLTGQGLKNPLCNYNKYNEEISDLLEVLEYNKSDLNAQHSECVSAMLYLFYYLIEADVPNISVLYKEIINFTLKWTQNDIVSSEALMVLKIIALRDVEKTSNILDNLIIGLPAFLIAFNMKDNGNNFGIEHNKRLAALLQLLRVMVQVDSTRQKVLDEIEEDMLTGIFVTYLGVDEDWKEMNETDTPSIEAISLCIYTLSLIFELAKYDASWTPLQNNLMDNKRIHLLLAQALFFDTPEDVKTLTFNITSNPQLSKWSISCALLALQTDVSRNSVSEPAAASSLAFDPGYPPLPVSQIAAVNATLAQVKTAFGDGVNGPVAAEVLDLYECKVAGTSRAEKAALMGVEGATERWTRLRHRAAQLSAERAAAYGLLRTTQQKEEAAAQKVVGTVRACRELSERLEAEKNRYKTCDSQLKIKEKEIRDLQNELEEIRKKLKQTTSETNDLQEKCERLQQLKVVISRLEESGNKLEKNLEKKEELLNKTNVNNESLKSQICQLESDLREKVKKYEEVQTVLEQKSQILETITKMANSSQN